MPNSSKYGEREPLDTFWERALAFHIYLLRRVFYYYASLQLWKARQVSRPFGFYIDTDLDDSESWKWFKDWKLPRYRAYVERKS